MRIVWKIESFCQAISYFPCSLRHEDIQLSGASQYQLPQTIAAHVRTCKRRCEIGTKTSVVRIVLLVQDAETVTSKLVEQNES